MNKDDKLLGEAYEQMNEGILDRMSARKAGSPEYKQAGGRNMLQKAGRWAQGKAIGALGGDVGQKTQSADIQQSVAVDERNEERIKQLLINYGAKIEKLITSMEKDAGKVGVDIYSTTDPAYQELTEALQLVKQHLATTIREPAQAQPQPEPQAGA